MKLIKSEMKRECEMERIFSIAFIVIMLLSLIPLATSQSIYCDVSVDADVSKNNYDADEPFRYRYMLDNYEGSWVDCTIEVTLTGPYTPATVYHSIRGIRLKKSHFPGSRYNSPWINVYPPSGGWTPGTHQLRVEVTGTGPRPCIIDREKLRTFTVLGPTPPASVSNLGETSKGTTWILWSWTNPSDSDFSHTEVYINGVFKADVNAPGNSYNATGLSPGTTYTIGTKTVDDSGNINAVLVTDTAVTSTGADTTPPASISNLGETSKGTTWILWSWTNPSDSDFSHTEVYINGVFKADVNAPGNSYNATGLSPGTTYTIETKTVDDSGNTNAALVTDTATTLASAPPSTTSSSATGAPIDTYHVDADVYAAGSGFATGTNVDIYVVLDQDWNNGDPIPADVTGSVETVSVVGGDVGPVLVWHAPLVVGEYDIVIDANQNGVYDTSTDGLDSGSPGFVVIDRSCCPSVPVGPDTAAAVPTISPIGAIILVGLLGIMAMGRIRRRFN